MEANKACEPSRKRSMFSRRGGVPSRTELTESRVPDPVDTGDRVKERPHNSSGVLLLHDERREDLDHFLQASGIIGHL